jgi:hypothetical protein
VAVEANTGMRSFFDKESYGILDTSWSQNSGYGLTESLFAIQLKTQGP